MIRHRGPIGMLGILAVALGVLFLPGLPARAQEPVAKPRDEALDDLLKDLKEADRNGAPVESKPSKPDPSQAKGKEAPKGKAEEVGPGGKPGGKPAPPKPAGEEVSGKDKDIDDLLEKLGETKDEPAPEERRPGGGGGNAGGPGPPGGGKGKDEPQGPGAGGLAGKDRELDEKLEEFAGIRRKKKREDSGGSGPTSEIIKQMREVEQRLGKPETGGETQAKQKEIVKKIETLIEQVKQSGSSNSKSMRMAQQQQQQQPTPGGQKPGQEPGTNPGGAPLQKPLKPTDRHAMAGGKDIWGHLPAELRQEMDNVLKEEALSTKVDMIRRYYLSVAKQKLVRGE